MSTIQPTEVINTAKTQGQGLLIVLSGPSGAGKGTLCKELVAAVPNLHVSVSATTRPPRRGEVNGKHYYFVSDQEFAALLQENKLLEYAEYCGKYYGTPQSEVEKAINTGKDIILEIEIQGALKVKEKFPHGIFIFIVPPSLDELAARISKRGTESQAAIRQRLTQASRELEYVSEYDYVVVNDKIETAVEKLKAILTAEKCKVKRRKIKF
ncbi:MAG TPA: guanylate kinase [Desulfobacteria bacterium]|nr:guanylate kinase [Desulfobacteria bacterium]